MKKQPRYENQAYLNYLKSSTCIISGVKGCDPAHLRIGSSAGMQEKPDDFRVLPITPTLHRIQHNMGERSLWTSFFREMGESKRGDYDHDQMFKFLERYAFVEWLLYEYGTQNLYELHEHLKRGGQNGTD